MSITSFIKRYVHQWTAPEKISVGNNTSSPNNKSSGNDMDEIDEYFYRPSLESSWKGEKQTIECLRKIIKKIEKYCYLVVIGYIQSGKSSLIIYYSTWMINNDMNVIIMTRNNIEDCESISSKLKKFKREKSIDFEVIDFSKQNKFLDEDDMIEKFNSKRKIFIIGGNSIQLKKINKIVDENDINPFVMCIDELDLNEKNDGTKFQIEFNKLKQSGKIAHVLGVTGTGLPVIFKKVDILTNQQIISLERPLNYKGIHNINFTNIDVKNDNIVENILERMLETSYAFFDKNADKAPPIVLIKDEYIKINQVQMMNNLRQNSRIKEKFSFIIHNGDGIIIEIPEKFNLEIKVKKSSSINKALQILKDRCRNIEYIAIISSNLAGRGLSYVSEDYSWHLSHMILIPSSGSTGTNIVQSCRLAGCYQDDIHLEMFTSREIMTELFAYDNLQEKCVEKCEECLMDEEELKSTLEKIILNKNCVPRRAIDNNLRLKYKIISNNYDKLMCGNKIDSIDIVSAKQKIFEECGIYPKIFLVEKNTSIPFNEENCKIEKKKFKDRGYKKIHTIKEKIWLIKNPEFMTKCHQNVDVMITQNNGFICFYIKKKIEINHGDLFLYQTPYGIFSAISTSGNKEDLLKVLNENKKIKLCIS